MDRNQIRINTQAITELQAIHAEEIADYRRRKATEYAARQEAIETARQIQKAEADEYAAKVAEQEAAKAAAAAAEKKKALTKKK